MWPFKKTVPSARRNNRWTGGNVNLVLPPLPPEDVGAYGARFYDTKFPTHSVEETCLCIFEAPHFSRRYGSINRIDLFVTTMALRTEGGIVAIALWHLLDAGSSLCYYEHFFDPYSDRTLQHLKKLEQQSKLKLVMRDNQSGQTTGFWEFENNFQMGDFASLLTSVSQECPTAPFDDRIAEIKRDYTTEKLISMTREKVSLHQEISEMKDVTRDPILVVAREDVESMNTSPTVTILKHFLSSPDLAQAYRERVDIAFHGYDDVREELGEIPQVREFVQKLDEEFPYWIFFLTKSGQGLMCILHCFLLPHLKAEARAQRHPKQLEQLLLKRWFPAMNAVCEFAGTDEDDNKLLTERAIRYFTEGPFTDIPSRRAA